MGIIFALLAAFLGSISNFCMRKSIDANGESRGYIVVQLSCSFLIMILLNPVRTGEYAISSPSILFGIMGGILLGLLMLGLGKALEKGPVGLSYACLNSATVIPALLMWLIFGSSYGHSYSLMNGFGSFLVLCSLIWGGWSLAPHHKQKTWFYLLCGLFITHALLLAFFEWWAIMINKGLPFHFLVPFHISSERLQWFMPTILLVAAVMQWLVYLYYKQGKLKKAELLYGILGGITNGACSFFLIMAPQVCTDWQHAMIFPIFSVTVIFICSAWAQVLYKEKINWLANALGIIGILIGTQ